MKKIVTLAVAIAALSFIPIQTANADHGSNRRIVGYTSCGQPIYSVYQIYGYDYCGRPLGRWVTQYPSNSYRERSEYRPDYCPPTRPDYTRHCEPPISGPRWGFSIRF